MLEAMAAGRPVVATNVGGARDLISHGENGLLARPDDVESLAEGLKRMLGDATQREIMAEKARFRARSFDFPQIAKRYIALYEEILASYGRETREGL
jgi:glycosyltransferase involved in cell wall biosynthesis